MLNYKKRQFTFIVFFIVEIPLLFSIATLFSFSYCCKNTQMTRDLRTRDLRTRDLRTRDPYCVHQTKIQVNFTLLNLPCRTSYNKTLLVVIQLLWFHSFSPLTTECQWNYRYSILLNSLKFSFSFHKYLKQSI